MKRFLTLTLSILTVVIPAALHAQPRPGGSGTHNRPIVFRDRAPRPHTYTVLPHH